MATLHYVIYIKLTELCQNCSFTDVNITCTHTCTILSPIGLNLTLLICYYFAVAKRYAKNNSQSHCMCKLINEFLFIEFVDELSFKSLLRNFQYSIDAEILSFTVYHNKNWKIVNTENENMNWTVDRFMKKKHQNIESGQYSSHPPKIKVLWKFDVVLRQIDSNYFNFRGNFETKR